MDKVKIKLFYITILCFPIVVLSQTGPGGVGSNDGTSNLKIWLRDINQFSDAGITPVTNGVGIQQWSDASGSNNHATQVNANRRPTYVTNVKNGYPTVEFTGTGNMNNKDEMRINFNISPNVTPTISVITIIDHNTANRAPFSKVFGHDNGGFDRGLGFDSRCSPESFHYFGNNGVSNGLQCFFSPLANTDFIVNATFTQTTFSGWYNGNRLINNVTNSNGSGKSVLTIGGITDRNSNPTFAEFWDGSITEFILFDRSLNDAENIIVANYLSAKYNTVLAANDVFNEDDIASGNYDHDVAGIGRVNATNLHNDSQGTGIVRISNPTNLGDDEFLMWGHDNGTLAFNSNTNIPSNITSKLSRTWRASEVNIANNPVDVGGINIQFDLSGVTGFSTSRLRLLIDTDNDGNFDDETPINGATSLGSNLYRFSNVTGITNNSRFTIAVTPKRIITNRRVTYRVKKS